MNDVAARRDRADARLTLARGILDDLQLLPRWRAHGEPFVVGSVGLGLVVRPDIDIETYVDELSVPAGFDIVATCLELPAVRGGRFKDCRNLPEGGLWWRLDYETPAETWTLDLWAFPRDYAGPRSTDLVTALNAALTDAQRDTVLRVKEEAAEQGARAHGAWLYRAVCEGGVTTYAEYLAWLGDQNVWERASWRPATG